MPAAGARAAARRQGLTRYVTGIACPHGHVAERMVSNGRCVQCLEAAKRTLSARAQARAYRRETYWSDPVSARAAVRAYGRRHPERIAATNKRRAAEIKRWHEENPEAVREHASRYRASDKGQAARRDNSRVRKLRMTTQVPAWADMEAMSALYALARLRTLETGIDHVVDHVVPIAGENVSGLHVETNLQVVTSKFNLEKGNTFPA